MQPTAMPPSRVAPPEDQAIAKVLEVKQRVNSTVTPNKCKSYFSYSHDSLQPSLTLPVTGTTLEPLALCHL